MFYGFNMNPMGPIGSGVSSGNVPAVANPLDNRPAGGGKGGGKGGGSPQPNYIASTPRPSMGKGGGKGGGFAPPPQNMYGGLGYNAYMGAGGIRPTSVPTQFSGFNQPTPMPSEGRIPLPETNFPLPPAPSAPPTPPAGKGGGLQARNDFINSDNELNRIRAEQMALERKARQEAKNRSYYDQPEEPTVAQQPANIVEPAPTMLPASRNPFNRRTMSQMDRLNAAYQDRMKRFDSGLGSPDSLQRLQKFGEALRNRVHFDSPEAEQRFNNQFGLPEPQPDPRYQQQQQRLLEEGNLVRQLIGGRRVKSDPERDLAYENYLRTRANPSRFGSGLGAGLGAFGLSNFFGGR